MENKEESIHVLLVAFSSQGHINPMLRLGKRLLSKNIHVTLATTEIARHRMLSSSSSDTTTIAGIRLEFFSDGFPIDYDRKTNLDHYMETLGRAGPINLSAIIENYGSTKFSCIVNNPFVPWVADVAAEHQIPCAMLWIQPCTLFSIYYRFYNNLNSFPTLENPQISVELLGLPLLKTQDLPTFVLPSNPFGSFPKLFSELFQNDLKKLKWVFCNSLYELEKSVINSMSDIFPILPIGPLVPSELLGENELDGGFSMWKSEDSCIEWLDKQERSSVIYVSFGSLVVLNKKQMESIGNGLKKSGRPFLWVVKPPDYAEKSGDGKLPEGFLEETKGQGLVVPWSPQIKVLMHPSVGCFLSHCGWNSTLETLAAGVPVIAYPQWSDQPTNAKLIADVWRVGVRLRQSEGGEVTLEEVEKCIEQVMSGPSSEEFKKNAAELKVAARQAVAADGSSDRNIQLFVDEISGKSTTS